MICIINDFSEQWAEKNKKLLKIWREKRSSRQQIPVYPTKEKLCEPILTANLHHLNRGINEKNFIGTLTRRRKTEVDLVYSSTRLNSISKAHQNKTPVKLPLLQGNISTKVKPEKCILKSLVPKNKKDNQVNDLIEKMINNARHQKRSSN